MAKENTPTEKVIVTDSLIHESRKRRLEKEKEELEELEKKHLEGDTKEKEDDEVDTNDNDNDESSEEEESGKSEKLSKEEETFKKRYGDLRRHAQKREEELKAKIAQLESGEKEFRPPAKDEDIEAWANKYPDVARIVETIASKKAKELFANAEHRLEEYEVAQAESARTKAENAIRKAHGDFDEIKSSDEFHDWAEEQPKWVQDAVYENADDPASVIRVLDLYKVDKGMTPSARKERDKDAARNVSSKRSTSIDKDGQKGVYKESDIAKMTDHEYAKHAKAIDEAMSNNKFIYDLTG